MQGRAVSKGPRTRGLFHARATRARIVAPPTTRCRRGRLVAGGVGVGNRQSGEFGAAAAVDVLTGDIIERGQPVGSLNRVSDPNKHPENPNNLATVPVGNRSGSRREGDGG